MQGFDFYAQAWVVYILLGVLFLFLIDLKLRKMRFSVRAGILSLLAVGAFTPQTVPDAESLAPLIITSLLNAEIEGVNAIYQGLITLGIVWGIVFTIALASKHLIDAQKNKTNTIE